MAPAKDEGGGAVSFVLSATAVSRSSHEVPVLEKVVAEKGTWENPVGSRHVVGMDNVQLASPIDEEIHRTAAMARSCNLQTVQTVLTAFAGVCSAGSSAARSGCYLLPVTSKRAGCSERVHKPGLLGFRTPVIETTAAGALDRCT